MMLPHTNDYDIRAQRYRPSDVASLNAEIRRLKDTGLTVRDISIALRLDLAQVLDALTHQ
jgi:DNA-binding transcriptional MerR regulator